MKYANYGTARAQWPDFGCFLELLWMHGSGSGAASCITAVNNALHANIKHKLINQTEIPYVRNYTEYIWLAKPGSNME